MPEKGKNQPHFPEVSHSLMTPPQHLHTHTEVCIQTRNTHTCTHILIYIHTAKTKQNLLECSTGGVWKNTLIHCQEAQHKGLYRTEQALATCLCIQCFGFRLATAGTSISAICTLGKDYSPMAILNPGSNLRCSSWCLCVVVQQASAYKPE